MQVCAVITWPLSTVFFLNNCLTKRQHQSKKTSYYNIILILCLKFLKMLNAMSKE